MTNKQEKPRFRGDCTGPHPLWLGHPGRLVRDRAWRKDIKMAAQDGEIDPLYTESAGPDAVFHVR